MATEALKAAETEWEEADAAAVAADYSAYEEEAAERKARGLVVKPPEGKSTWRNLPPIKGRKIWYYRAWSHNVNNKNLEAAITLFAALPQAHRLELARDFGVADISASSLGDGYRATLCESKMNDGPCLDCKIVSALYKISRVSDALKHAADIASEIKSKEEYFVAAVRVDDPKEMGMGPKILQLPGGVFEKMNKIFFRATTEEELGGDFTHPDRGYNVIIDRVVTMGPDKKPIMVTLKNGKTIPKTEYQVTAGRSQSKIKDPSWLKQLPDLTKAREPGNEAATRNALEGARPAAPAQALPGREPAKQIAASAPMREPGDDDDVPAGDPAEWIEDPEAAGDYDTRANLRAKGRRV
jgi:hypothetical protein